LVAEGVAQVVSPEPEVPLDACIAEAELPNKIVKFQLAAREFDHF
jgi:hypothetical protein